MNAHVKEIYLAGGCFWGLQAYMKKLPGVKEVVSGYANGYTENPTYEDLIHNNSGHAETVRVVYDPDEISLRTLLRYYMRVIDPTSINRQGNDRGVQYRTGIYYINPIDEKVVCDALAKEQKKHSVPLAVEVKPLENFTLAEEYHQDYLDKHPGGYCHIDLSLAEEPLSEDE